MAFENVIAGQVRGGSVDAWSEEEVFRTWSVLVGERMKGAQTTFTRNWVWNRLADGNLDHGPRALLQLLREAVEWERTERQRSPYDRSVIRPRALVPALNVVSGEALQALVEEFPELNEFIARLQALRRSPVDAAALEGMRDELALARDVGLLEVYEETDQEVRRYRVPDLYRVALGMTRMGPG